MNKAPSLAVENNSDSSTDGRSLAKRLELPLCDNDDQQKNDLLCSLFDFILRYEVDKKNGISRLALTMPNNKLGGSIFVDLVGGKAAHRHHFGGGRRQSLAKAVGLKGGKNPTVIDATAGLGRDAFVLACLGAQVMLIERSPILTALLEDGLGRASHDPALRTIITERMNLVTADAIEWLTNLPIEQHPDVVYMDPMYPHRNKSALVKKEMRVLRELVGDDEDASQLLHTALTCAKRRVTVKRPRTAPILSGSILNNRKPNSTVESKNTRYDIYVP